MRPAAGRRLARPAAAYNARRRSGQAERAKERRASAALPCGVPRGIRRGAGRRPRAGPGRRPCPGRVRRHQALRRQAAAERDPGAVHYLRELCGANDGQKWRNHMKELMDNEVHRAAQARLTRSFNNGYRSYSRTYSACSASRRPRSHASTTEGAEIAETWPRPRLRFQGLDWDWGTARSLAPNPCERHENTVTDQRPDSASFPPAFGLTPIPKILIPIPILTWCAAATPERRRN
jgi:uncharacterized protein (TIGR02301 family)